MVVGRTVRGRSGMVSRRCLVSICRLGVCLLGVSVAMTVAVALAVTTLIGLIGMWCVCVSCMMA